VSVEGKLRELLEELLETFQASPDPFKVRVRELLEELARLLPQLELSDMPLDAEIVYRLAEVVKRQEEWLASEASTLALGRLVAALKVQVLSERELALQLLSAWRPAIALEQVTFTDMLRAVEYMSGRRPRAVFEGGGEAVGVMGLDEAVALGVVSRVKLEEIIEKVKRRALELLEKSGTARYLDVVSGSDLYETYLNAYALSLLSSAGEFDVAYDPLGDEYYVVKGGSGGEPSSVAIPLAKVVEGAG